MDKLNIANGNLKTAQDARDRDYEAQIAKLNKHENNLLERLSELNRKKLESTKLNGNLDAKDDDLIEVNAGGKIIAAKRSTFTQLKGTRLEGLFSGRWDRILQRDNHGQIFLDINPVGLRAIVRLSERANDFLR